MVLTSDHPNELTLIAADLIWLFEHGAHAGVAEIIRERRRQIENGHTPESDDRLREDGSLVQYAWMTARGAQAGIGERSEGPEFAEEKMRRAGALAAAEIDRLNRMLAGE